VHNNPAEQELVDHSRVMTRSDKQLATMFFTRLARIGGRRGTERRNDSGS
jgi:hypothetical protein